MYNIKMYLIKCIYMTQKKFTFHIYAKHDNAKTTKLTVINL